MSLEAQSGASAAERVLELLKNEGGGLSVREMCRLLDLSSMAVRRQVALLEGRALVYSVKVKKPTGRPEQHYYLTREGHEEFERDYANAAIELLVQLRNSHGKERVNEILKLRKDAHLEEFRDRMSGKTLATRVHEVTRLLTEQGYRATWEKLGHERFLIKEMNCAVELIARRFPQTCLHEEDLLAELLEAKVTRQHHLLQKDHFCSYLVEG